MAFTADNATALFRALTSLPKRLGVFDKVNSHEPLNAPGNGVNCSITLGPIGPAPSGLDATSMRIEFLARIFVPMLQRPLDPIDPQVLAATFALLAAYNGSFELTGLVPAGLVRNIDLLAATAAPAYLMQDGKEFRVMQVTVPVIVNDAFDQGA
jgi:hypothetical protein